MPARVGRGVLPAIGLSPAMKVIDAHHHYWDSVNNPHPWLRNDSIIPFRYGDYAAIRQTVFMPEEYDRVSEGWEVVTTVTMEGEWTADDPIGEAIWMQELANETARPAAHAAQAWLDQPSLASTLSAYSKLPIVKSVRHKPRANSEPDGPPGGMTDAAFIEGFKRLGDAGLMFELQTPWWHLKEAMEMVQHSPDTAVILNHAGLPSDRSAEGIAGWQEALREFAGLPNAYVKISGLGLSDQAWQLADNLPIIRYCIDTFGATRCMFASNFPVDGLCGSFNTIYSGFDAATKNDKPEEREALFFGTAARVYGINTDHL